mgnify:CR=1 FL=1
MVFVRLHFSSSRPHLSPPYPASRIIFPLNPSFTATQFFSFYRKDRGKENTVKGVNTPQHHHNNTFLSRQYHPPLHNPLRTNLHLRRPRLPLRLTLLSPPARQITVFPTIGHFRVCQGRWLDDWRGGGQRVGWGLEGVLCCVSIFTLLFVL